eukprot:CAMPEP_0198140296 /NCGR_PEP_ID=MMETSP1443-20131203/3471_1 /TAXON_ID=186043 /ORGANISM="Entomoneis sp., Strain CCMP2396" /LENGTH=109 /DNA_ID=CAMNT_0043802669 /DNA_START=117 /DNA_END=446 /DNA_ORIENTATION=+
MVRVFYEPPPYGPRTNLNKTNWGSNGGGLLGRRNLEILCKMNPNVALGVPIIGFCGLAFFLQTFAFSKPKPFSMEPEYQAAQRAYMRYHNMNPIFGISSKKARAMDPDS